MFRSTAANGYQEVPEIGTVEHNWRAGEARHMRRLVFAIASSVLGALLVHIGLTLAAELSGASQWAVVLGMAVVSFLLAYFAAGRLEPLRRITIGSSIKADGDVSVRGVKVRGSRTDDVAIGSELGSGGSVEVTDVDVGVDGVPAAEETDGT